LHTLHETAPFVPAFAVMGERFDLPPRLPDSTLIIAQNMDSFTAIQPNKYTFYPKKRMGLKFLAVNGILSDYLKTTVLIKPGAHVFTVCIEG
jgi:hypothetical protein